MIKKNWHPFFYGFPHRSTDITSQSDPMFVFHSIHSGTRHFYYLSNDEKTPIWLGSSNVPTSLLRCYDMPDFRFQLFIFRLSQRKCQRQNQRQGNFQHTNWIFIRRRLFFSTQAKKRKEKSWITEKKNDERTTKNGPSIYCDELKTALTDVNFLGKVPKWEDSGEVNISAKKFWV